LEPARVAIGMEFIEYYWGLSVYSFENKCRMYKGRCKHYPA
jgi:hypothetical protein